MPEKTMQEMHNNNHKIHLLYQQIIKNMIVFYARGGSHVQLMFSGPRPENINTLWIYGYSSQVCDLWTVTVLEPDR